MRAPAPSCLTGRGVSWLRPLSSAASNRRGCLGRFSRPLPVRDGSGAGAAQSHLRIHLGAHVCQKLLGTCLGTIMKRSVNK